MDETILDGKYVLVGYQMAFSWFYSEFHCEDVYGTNLATINSEEDYEIAIQSFDILGGNGVQGIWIGLTNLPQAGAGDGYIWYQGPDRLDSWYIKYLMCCTLYVYAFSL